MKERRRITLKEEEKVEERARDGRRRKRLKEAEERRRRRRLKEAEEIEEGE